MRRWFELLVLLGGLCTGWTGCSAVAPESEGVDALETLAPEPEPEPILYPMCFQPPGAGLIRQMEVPMKPPLLSVELEGGGSLNGYAAYYQHAPDFSNWQTHSYTNGPGWFLMQMSSNAVTAEVRGVAGESTVGLFVLFDGLELPEKVMLEQVEREAALKGRKRWRN